MWVVAIGIIGLVISGGELARAQEVHFDLTSGDCSENSTVVTECSNLYTAAYHRSVFTGTYTKQFTCVLITETLACVETALCYCNFSSTHPQLKSGYSSAMVLYHYYNNITSCANISHGDNIEGEVTGAIEPGQGVNCTKYNRMTGDLALSLAVAQLPLVQEAEEVCAGVEECYYHYDRGLEVALFQRDWLQFCQESLVLLQCLVSASCACGQESHETILYLVNTERQIDRNNCDAIRPEPAAIEKTISCPASDICGWENPHFNCLEEFTAALGVSTQNKATYCQALYTLANCTENLACLCGFYNQSGYYRSLAVAKHEYVHVAKCEEEDHPAFPNHEGLNCGDDDRFTEDEKILSIALAETAFVVEEQARCPGIQHCYEVADRKTAEGHRMKDLSVICQADSERIQCVEDAYCHCGLLNDDEVYGRLVQQRLAQGNLCYSVTGLIPITRCRGTSTCKLGNSLVVCQREYSYDYSVAQTFEDTCQATKNYITCAEQVGCACGLLNDGSSLEAKAVYNITTLTLQLYDEAGCPGVTGAIYAEEDGIGCPDAPDDDTKLRRLALSYADSSEVAALAEDCKPVQGCFKTDDKERGYALFSRNYEHLCRTQSSLIHCVENAYCQCGLNGTEKAESYITTQINSHDAFCYNSISHVRKPCTVKTSSAPMLGSSAGLMVMVTILLTSAIWTF